MEIPFPSVTKTISQSNLSLWDTIDLLNRKTNQKPKKKFSSNSGPFKSTYSKVGNTCDMFELHTI